MPDTGDIIQNVNPRSSQSQTAKPAPTQTAMKKPIGAVMEERKVQAAKKSIMTVDARLYGVKPTELAKYINTLIKPSPFNGIVYNKAMFALAKTSVEYAKHASINSFVISKELIGLRKDIVSRLNTQTHTEKQESNKLINQEKKVAAKLGEIVKGNTEDRRRSITAERQLQKNEQAPDAPGNQKLDETNRLLKEILERGGMEAKKAEKVKGKGFIGSILGFISNPLKFVWDMIGGIPFAKPIVGGILTALTAFGVGKIITTLFPGATDVLYKALVPESIRNVISGIKDTLNILGSMVRTLFRDPKEFMDKVGQSFNLLIGMMKTEFLSPALFEIKKMTAQVGYRMSHLWPGTYKEEELQKQIEGIKVAGHTVTAEKIPIDRTGKNSRFNKKTGKWEQWRNGRWRDEKEGDVSYKLSPDTKQPGMLEGMKNIWGMPSTPPNLITSYTGELPSGVKNQENFIATLNRVMGYDKYIQEAVKEYPNVNPNLLRAVMAQESRGREGLVSGAGAAGLMQFMPKTAPQYGMNVDPSKGIDERLDPRKSIFGAAKYLNYLQSREGSEVYAAGAYNAGEGNFEKWLAGKRDLKPETKGYMHDVPIWASAFSQNAEGSDIKAITDQIKYVEQHRENSAIISQKQLIERINVLIDVTKANKQEDKGPPRLVITTGMNQ